MLIPTESDKMIELVQQFRDFKPYLKKRLAFIHESGRELELRAEIEDIEFYLDIMRDILADEYGQHFPFSQLFKSHII